jgi:hypothetical protein
LGLSNGLEHSDIEGVVFIRPVQADVGDIVVDIENYWL